MSDWYEEIEDDDNGNRDRRCRVCSCTEASPCTDDAGVPCYWVEEELCSACADAEAEAI